MLLEHRCPLNEAEPYGVMLTCPRGHYEVWEQWRDDAGAAPIDFSPLIAENEYEEWPRGRIVYDTGSKRFTLYADA